MRLNPVIIYKNCLDHEHEISYHGIEEHGHYNVPIVINEQILGVLVVYLSHLHPDSDNERLYLMRVADIIGLGISRFQYEDRIEHQAYHDALTDLPNRRLLINRLNKEIAIAKRHRRFGALFFIDLDNFKNLNDSKGHRFGDELIITIAGLISNLLRKEDTVARVGGDEFVVILPAISSQANVIAFLAQQVAEKLRIEIERQHSLDKRLYFVTASIGITIIDGEENSAENLLSQADTAMYTAKASGKNKICFFEPAMQSAILERISLEYELRIAIENDQFEIYYQPQVTVDKKIIGAEALIRWNHPTKGFVSPAMFIPVAEQSGLISQLDHLVFRKTIKDIKKLGRGDVYNLDGINSISINISSQTFEAENFIADISQVVAQSEQLPIAICLELTERIIVKDIHQVTEKMERLKEFGFKLSIDDFGTGYSSLAYLKNMPFDVLKIDIIFVRNLHLSKKDSAVAASILALSDTLDLKCIAEGVEVNEEVRFLHQKGCQLFQGYYFYKPMPFDELCSFLIEN